jgi:hypothetical protein
MKQYFILKYDPKAEYSFDQISLDCPTTRQSGDLAQIVAQAVSQPGTHLVSVRIEVEILQSRLLDSSVQPEVNNNGHTETTQTLEYSN